MKPTIHFFELTYDVEHYPMFKEVGKENLLTSHETEPGTLAMYASHLATDKNCARVFEIYENEAAYESHRQSPQFQNYVKTAGSLLMERLAYDLVPELLLEKDQPLVETTDRELTVKLAKLTLKADQVDQFRKVVFAEMKAAIDKEAGVLAMYATHVAGQEEHWIFFEVYKNSAAYDFHRETPHFKEYISKTADMVLDKCLINLVNETAVSKGGLRLERGS
ncbi:putative quinol monooxygenase [Streptococcus massiliensis]|uniref:Antibiotic biosynthesis monooxygenase n=1 Tax=Streptococcus massiliensis TaxID=313439 RepID=A0A380KZ04_9STRE|nr:antibiotic biosynthesis monooxygenase [Streptococcus massiliensis]SUN76166.1 antibiotic biosynthesis monooxygenase [Streptococcus massiliensis]